MDTGTTTLASFLGIIPISRDTCFQSALWYINQVPALDPRVGDTLLSSIPVLFEKMKAEDPKLYEEVKKCEIYGTNNLTGAETVFTHRALEIPNSWPLDCSCCESFENFVWKHFYPVPWKNFDFVVGDNNQVLHHAPRIAIVLDGSRVLRRLESLEWMPGHVTGRKPETPATSAKGESSEEEVVEA